MNKFSNNDFSDLMFQRRSIRSYDENYKIPQTEMLEMLQQASTAPSSVNLQPWRFVVVESPAGKEKLKPLIRFNTHQNDTSAAMLLLFGDLKCYENTEKIYHQAYEAGKMPKEVMEKQIAGILSHYQNLTESQMREVVKIDTSLAAMQLMLVARAHGYDTNPIGGFEADHLAEKFDLDPERYVPVMILSIGKALEAGYPSIRLDVEDLTTFK